jgi:type I restriction enzyme M protein
MPDDKKLQLETKLWSIADTLRGKMNADDFRDYILGFIFYKYLSEKMHDYANEILKPDKLKYEDVEKHKSSKNCSQRSRKKRLKNWDTSYCLQSFLANSRTF